MEFPQFISFTLTNLCNLRCQMCGQWSNDGYIRNGKEDPHSCLDLSVWKRLVDEAANYKIRFILIRGGEPFLYRGIIELLEHIKSKGIFISIDTNGTILRKYAEDLVRIGNMHITFSVDGPEEIHDSVRGVKGCFRKLKENIEYLHFLEKDKEQKISKSICFTISPYSYKGLGEMPDIARSLGISSMSIVPYFYFTPETGSNYEKELQKNFRCRGFSWRGFCHEESGIDMEIFRSEYRKYLSSLGEVYNYPYMDFNEDNYNVWFSDQLTQIGAAECMNAEKLIDIQPNGNANFCVDFPDYSFGNVKDRTIHDLWNRDEANMFRAHRRKSPLSICYRCGAKYISEIK